MGKYPVARVGDSTTHGGVIITGDPVVTVNDRPMARVGDTVMCPKCGKTTIITGAKDIFGNQHRIVAVKGSKTSCGAVVNSGSPNVFAFELVETGYETGGPQPSHQPGYSDRRGQSAARQNATASAAPGSSANSAGKLEARQKPNYDEQFKIVDDKTGKPIPDMRYMIKTRNGGVVLAEGVSDKDGLTERVHANAPEVVDLFTFDVQDGVEEVHIDTAITNTSPKSVHTARYKRGRLFFSIAYDVPDQAFQRAAIGYRSRSQRIGGGYRPILGDIWLSYCVRTESDFVTAWSKIAMAQKRWGMAVAEGRILTHGSIGDESGLDFKREIEFKQQVGLTLDYNETEYLLKLEWTKNSSLYLHSCCSGIKDKTGLALAEIFSKSQDVSTVYGQNGFAYFSKKHDFWIDAEGYTGTNLYLWAFRRPRNIIFFKNPLLLDCTWIPPLIIRKN